MRKGAETQMDQYLFSLVPAVDDDKCPELLQEWQRLPQPRYRIHVLQSEHPKMEEVGSLEAENFLDILRPARTL